VIVVKPTAEGGKLSEQAKIGHTKESTTFLPQAVVGTDFIYCDCPGFLDNRGAEINIANAVNIKTALQKTASARVVALLSHHSLIADKARGLYDTIQICDHLFGSSDNIRRHSSAILLGITDCDASLRIDSLKRYLQEGTPEIMKTLADRVFLYDPLERNRDGWWNRDRVLQELRQAGSIENPESIFQTVLTAEDERRLIAITQHMTTSVDAALSLRNYKGAATTFHHLQRLSVVDHIVVERLLNSTTMQVRRQCHSLTDEVKSHCHFERFDEAERLVGELYEAHEQFGFEVLQLSPSSMHKYVTESKAKATERAEKERANDARLKNAQDEIDQMQVLLSQQKEAYVEEKEIREAQYLDLSNVYQKRTEELIVAQQANEEQLKHELEQRLTRMANEHIAASQEEQERNEAEKEFMKAEYEKQAREATRMIEKFRNEEQERQRQALVDHEQEMLSLHGKLAAVETQQEELQKSRRSCAMVLRSGGRSCLA